MTRSPTIKRPANQTSPHRLTLRSVRRLLQMLIAALVFAALAACGTSPVDKDNEHFGVSVQSLNYSSREVSYIAVERPGHPEGGAGGDSLNPYGAGGDICCFSVPAKWSPDFKVVVVYQFYPETEYRRVEVGVPPYRKAGDIWLIVHPDFSVEAVVSKWGPSRPEWPGAIKGYPVPSREYRLKMWKKRVEEQKAEILDGKSQEEDPTYSSYTAEEKDRLQKNIEFAKQYLNYLLEHKP